MQFIPLDIVGNIVSFLDILVDKCAPVLSSFAPVFSSRELDLVKCTWVKHTSIVCGVLKSLDVKLWHCNGCLHRKGAPAVEWDNGDKHWYRNDRIHRDGGPAIETRTLKQWISNGKTHRADGPAVETVRDKQWWWRGVFLFSETFPRPHRRYSI